MLGWQGVAFQKKPDKGRMKGLAFAYDPDRCPPTVAAAAAAAAVAVAVAVAPLTP